VKSGTSGRDEEDSLIVPKVSYTQIALSGALWLTLAKVINVVAKLASVAILARLISPSEFGLFAAAGLLVSLASTLSEGTFALPLVQRETITPSHVQTTLWVSTCTSVLMMGLIVLAAPSAERFFGFDGLHLIVLGLVPVILFKSIASVGMAVLQRAHRFAATMATMVTAQVAGYVIPAIVLAVQGYGIWALVWGQVVASALEAMFACLLSRCPLRPVFDITALRQVLRFGSFLTMARLSNWLALQVDNVVVGRVLGAEALGLYSRSYNLLAIATQVLGDPASRALLPAFSRMQEDRARLDSGFRRGLGIAVPFYAFVSGIAILHGEALIGLILGPRWLDAVMPLQLLFFAFVARAGYKFTESVLLATGQFGRTALRQIIYFALIGIAAFFGSRFGVSGVAAGVSLALWIFYAISLKWVHDTIGVGWRWLVLLHVRAFVLAAFGASLDIAVQVSLAPSGYWLAQVISAAAFCGFCAGVTMTGPTWLVGLEVSDMRKLLIQKLSTRLGRFGI